MTGLLVSVRNVAEARAALRGGADLIDVKEPHHGSLGAAWPQIWQEIRAAMPANVPLSAALGELLDDSAERMSSTAEQLAGYQFAKIGLAGCRQLADWKTRWRRVLAGLPLSTAPVAVIYADWNSAGAPAPEEVLRAAQEAHCAAVLIDTYAKDRGGLIAHLTRDELAELMHAARKSRFKIVLAGSLTLSLARDLLPLAPDFFAVRGAVCRGGRTGIVDEALVAAFAKYAFVKPMRNNQPRSLPKASGTA